MTRTLPRALALALAGALAAPALAADKPATDKPASEKSFGSKEPDLTRKPTKKKQEPPPTPAQLQYRAIRTAKAAFMGAVGSCKRPEMCDPKSPARDPEAVALVEKTQRQFVDACEACATVDACEEERARIRAGTASFRTNPCFKKEPEGAKEAKGTGAKGAAETKKDAKGAAPAAADAKKDAKGAAPAPDAAKPGKAP